MLHIEPGLAFGTGTHETTRLCMELIEDYLRPQMDVLDVGCGSGILSVAALIMGARSATGVDIDELAVKTAAENAEINRVGDRFTAIAGNLTDKDVRDALENKFEIIDRREENGWVALAAQPHRQGPLKDADITAAFQFLF